MILHTDVSMTVEENSITDGREQNAKLYLFETHVCLETVLFGLNNRRKVRPSHE